METFFFFLSYYKPLSQAGTNKAIFSRLTRLIPRHFDDCLPFSMFTIADINKINSADFNQTLEKFDQKCFAETHIWLAYPRNTTLHNPDRTLLSFGKKTLPAAVYPH